MMNKLRTWWRIKRRMMAIHLSEIYVWLEFPLRLLVNYIFFFTLFIWVGLAFMFWIVVRSIHDRKSAERSVLSGKIWAWEMFKLY